MCHLKGFKYSRSAYWSALLITNTCIFLAMLLLKRWKIRSVLYSLFIWFINSFQQYLLGSIQRHLQTFYQKHRVWLNGTKSQYDCAWDIEKHIVKVDWNYWTYFKKSFVFFYLFPAVVLWYLFMRCTYWFSHNFSAVFLPSS